jgi:hypothetical protein
MMREPYPYGVHVTGRAIVIDAYDSSSTKKKRKR